MSKKIPNKITKSRTNPQSGAFYVAPACLQGGEVNRTLPLYRFVYASQTSLFLVVLLLSSFLLQGVERVYANEITVADSESVAVLNPEVAPSIPVEDVSIEEDVSEIQSTDEEQDFGGDTEEEALNTVESVTADSFTEDNSPESIEESLPTVDNTSIEDGEEIDETSETVADEDVVLESIDDTTVDENNSSFDDVFEDVETAPHDALTDEGQVDIPEEDLQEEQDLLDDITIDTTLVATNTEIATEMLSYTESDSVFSFSKEECTELATGSFYCHKPQENQLQDALFAAPDADGDLEIFLVRGGIETQITTNTIDDAAPYYDQNSHTIVWHRLIDDRYQIVSYDITEASERVLTNTPENNMEPTRQGNYTVWQRWIDGGWNIILFDGQKETQITKTTSHNVAPYIHGSLVVWNRHDQVNEKTIEMYDMVSGTYVTVEDPDGMSVSNPRMVFVYDSLHPNGDIVTKGYDVLAKKFIDLDSLPRELPEEIPESDSTGETRALIQLKSSSKSEVEEAVPFPGTASSTASSSAPVATTTAQVILDALTLDLTTATATEPLPGVTTQYEIPPAELDLVIEPYITNSSTTIDSVQE